MRVAIPLLEGSFCPHFGGADSFAIFEVDDQTRTVVASHAEIPPPHEHGVFPTWLRSQGVAAVLAGGMGPRAVQMLEHFGIDTVLGVTEGEPVELVKAYLGGELQSTGSTCAAPGMHGCHGH
ncbi:MAG TPA: NifB/NifX family molybdenum-iron cluster-binding protein [Thermoanaerobaculaceae bacterium]|nr:NifB/NifX family molybdenum-iron cluster-binding protein [Thermoanaerobaculaceae bacterium]HPS77862.1 NifB/NifX family molybdenum-iron cluster-binding protein [Thermoanaerobaculaceae bacterium]